MRNRRYFIFTVALPVILYLLLGRQFSGTVYGVSFRAFYMVDMAMLGAFSGALNGNAQRISQEKKEGWIRQLRLTSLPANAYVVSKVLVSMATTVASERDAALTELGDIGRVSRQTLQDIREAVSGYRRPTLATAPRRTASPPNAAGCRLCFSATPTLR